jgi:non-homologous end joining protein Ku
MSMENSNGALRRRAKSTPTWSLAEAIIERRSSAFELAGFQDRYQGALRELVEAKINWTGDNASCNRRAA